MRIRWLGCFASLVLVIAPALRAADDDPNAPVDPARYDRPVKLACVGDSITEGAGTSRGKVTSWPGVLSRMLGEKWDVGNFGSSGRTLLKHGDVPYQTQGPLKPALKFEPDVVVIMLGTNDSKPWNWTHKDEFAADYKDLIDKFRALPTHPRVFVCRPPVVTGEGNFGIKEENVQAEMPILDAVAAEEKTGVIDIHAATADHGDLLPDHVHPNDQGAEVIARAMYKGLTGAEFTGEIPPPPPAAAKPANTKPAATQPAAK